MNGQIIAPLRTVLRKYGEEKVIEILSTYHDCIGSDQESFLKDKAIMMEKKNMCRTYLAIDGDSRILGYYSIGLRCMKVPKKKDEDGEEMKDDRFTLRMNVDPETRVAQSYLIGQLSRSRDAPKGFGSKLMEDAIRHIMDANLIVGCRLVRVDCDDKLIGYYSKLGFNEIKKNDDGDLNQMAYILRSTEGS
ncbi:MAG: hypothetical protein IJT54_05560 [Candidatus Methanomethylophilaceae archaeon]|nr:hypothetical protein [Candidatus Methanomethylophilaceae archaeon]